MLKRSFLPISTQHFRRFQPGASLAPLNIDLVKKFHLKYHTPYFHLKFHTPYFRLNIHIPLFFTVFKRTPTEETPRLSAHESSKTSLSGLAEFIPHIPSRCFLHYKILSVKNQNRDFFCDSQLTLTIYKYFSTKNKSEDLFRTNFSRSWTRNPVNLTSP